MVMDRSLFYRVYEQLPRQGPGDARCTRRAFAALPDLGSTPRILDIGCGTGRQTLDLAALSTGTITAVDNHQPFLDTLAERAREAGAAERVTCRCLDMGHMDFPEGAFDLIWSEGSIFVLGFKRGLRQWRPLLRSRGALAVSEIAWLREDPPVELIDFWGGACPDMGTPALHLATARRCGFDCLTHFVVSQEAWWADYYRPLEARLAGLRDQPDAAAVDLLEVLDREVRMYRKYSDYYGYVFYVLQRTD